MADAPGSKYHESGEPLPELLVVDTERGCLGHGGVGSERPFHLDRVHVLPARHDHLVVAAHHEQSARLVDIAHIT